MPIQYSLKKKMGHHSPTPALPTTKLYGTKVLKNRDCNKMEPSHSGQAANIYVRLKQRQQGSRTDGQRNYQE